MDLKKEVKDIIKWAQESEENKKIAINAATMIISFINSEKKDLTDQDLKTISGGDTILSLCNRSAFWQC
jgi:hypothetical protein